MSTQLKTKIFVVGLGGTGKLALIHLKKKLFYMGITDTTREDNIELVSIDFDATDKYATVPIDKRKTIIELSNEEKCYLSSSKIRTRLRNVLEKENKEFYEHWYPDPEGEMITYGMQMAGASQWRPLGRVGFIEHSHVIHQTLKEKLYKLMEYDEASSEAKKDKEVVIYVIASLAGGTGSGIFLDTAYYLRDIAPYSPIYGLFLLSNVYRRYDAERGRIFANSYAALKELNVFANQGHMFETVYPSGERLKEEKRAIPPFDSVFIYDNRLGLHTTVSRPELMTEIMADFIYVDVYLWQEQASAFTNIIESHSKANIDEFGKRCVFHVAGTTSINFPAYETIFRFLQYKYAIEILCKNLSLERADKEVNEENFAEEDQIESKKENDKLVNIDGNLRRIRSYLKNSHDELIKVSKDITFSADDSIQFATRMYNAIDNWGLEDHVVFELEEWKNELLAQDGKIRFKNGVNLPNELDIFMPLIDAFKTNLSKEIKDAKEKANTTLEKDIIDRKIRKQISLLVNKLQNEAKIHNEKVDSELVAQAGKYQEILKTIKKTINAKPWKMGQMEYLAFRNILIRLFSGVIKPLYAKDLKYLRVNNLLINTLNTALRESSLRTDEETERIRELFNELYENLLEKSEEYKQLILKEVERIGDSMTENYMLDENYLEQVWSIVSDHFCSEDDLFDEFENYLRRDYGINEMASIMTVAELEKYSLVFSFDKIETVSESIDPLAFASDEKLQRFMIKAKNDFIITNVVDNPNNKTIVFISIPVFSKRSAPNGDLCRNLKTIINNIFGAPVISESYVYPKRYKQIEESTSEDFQHNKLVVKFVSLYHPSYNIFDINRYYYFYRHYSKDLYNNTMFHLSKDFVSFPEIVTDSEKIPANYLPLIVYCGNPGCTSEISSLDRSEIFCPECHRPIKTRCGNEECPADNLDRHDDIKGKKVPPKTCPTCRNDLKTRWWFCERHNKYILTEHIYCPDCILDHNRGLLSFEEVSAVKGTMVSIPCDGCLGTGFSIDEAYKIDFKNLYHEIPENMIEEADKIFFNPEKTIKGKCPKCRSLLLPVCPYCDVDVEKYPHYVHRKKINGHEFLVCTTHHPEKRIFECAYCNFPITEDMKFCPRCKSELKEIPQQLIESLELEAPEFMAGDWSETEIEKFRKKHIRPLVHTKKIKQTSRAKPIKEKISEVAPEKENGDNKLVKDFLYKFASRYGLSGDEIDKKIAGENK